MSTRGRPKNGEGVPVEVQQAMVDDFLHSGLSAPQYAAQKGISRNMIQYLKKKWYGVKEYKTPRYLEEQAAEYIVPRKQVVVDPVAAMQECKRRLDAWKVPRSALYRLDGEDDTYADCEPPAYDYTHEWFRPRISHTVVA